MTLNSITNFPPVNNYIPSCISKHTFGIALFPGIRPKIANFCLLLTNIRFVPTRCIPFTVCSLILAACYLPCSLLLSNLLIALCFLLLAHCFILPAPCSLLLSPVPCSFLICSLHSAVTWLPAPCFLLLAPCSLLLATCYLLPHPYPLLPSTPKCCNILGTKPIIRSEAHPAGRANLLWGVFAFSDEKELS